MAADCLLIISATLSTKSRRMLGGMANAFMVLFFLSGCGSDGDYGVIEASHPLERVFLQGDDLVIYPAKEVDWKSLVNLKVFGNFRPGSTFSDARKLYGVPDESATNEWGPYWVYHRTNASIVIAYQEETSGGSTFRAWRLYAYPRSKRLDDFLHQSIMRHVKARHGQLESVVIMSSSRSRPALELTVRNMKVEALTWYP